MYSIDYEPLYLVSSWLSFGYTFEYVGKDTFIVDAGDDDDPTDRRVPACVLIHCPLILAIRLISTCILHPISRSRSCLDRL